MVDSPAWNVYPSHDLNQKRKYLTTAELNSGYLESLAYINDPFAYQSLRPAATLHVETGIPLMPAMEHYLEYGPLDFQQYQFSYSGGLKNDTPVLQEKSNNTQPFDGRDTVWTNSLSPASLHSTSTYDSPLEESAVSPRATRHSSCSSTQSLSDYANIQLLEGIAPDSPVFDTGLFGEHYHLPTIADRVQKLSLHSMRLFKSCGPDPNIQSAVLDIFESPEIQANAPITSEMAAPLLEKVKYINRTHGKGKRGAPQFYKCLWGSCGEKMSRKLHALEHIMNHVDNRSHVCDHCGKGFVRKNELKKHSPCKALKRSLRCINHAPVSMYLGYNFALTASPHCSNSAPDTQILVGQSYDSSKPPS